MKGSGCAATTFLHTVGRGVGNGQWNAISSTKTGPGAFDEMRSSRSAPDDKPSDDVEIVTLRHLPDEFELISTVANTDPSPAEMVSSWFAPGEIVENWIELVADALSPG